MKNFVEGFQPRSRLDRDGSGDITNTPIDMQSWDSSLNDLGKVKISRRDFLKLSGLALGSLFVPESLRRPDVTITTRPSINAYFWEEIQPGNSLILGGVLPIEINLIKKELMKVNWNGTEVIAGRKDLKSKWTVNGNGQQIEWNPKDDLVISGSFPFTFLANTPNPVDKLVGGNLFIHDVVNSIVATWEFRQK